MDTDHANAESLEFLRDTYGSGDPLGWEQVHAFESEHRIILPEPYRTFVAEISNGSDWGERYPGLFKLAAQPPSWPEPRFPGKPFPLTEAWVWEGGPRGDHDVEELITATRNHGSIVLSTEGGGMYWLLIVTGAHRGHVWNIAEVGAQPWGSEFGYTTGQSGFSGWLRHHMDGKPWFD